MSDAPFDAAIELDLVRTKRDKARRHQYRKSRLVRYRAELVKLRKCGASYPEIASWLRTKKRIKVAHTTVMRYLVQLPELHEEKTNMEAQGEELCETT